MKPHILKPFYLKAFLLFTLFSYSSFSFAQINVQVTVDSGTSTTTCGDVFGAPDPQWRVNINNQGWTTYPATNFCYQNPPFLQYSEPYLCPADVPQQVEVCFRAFEDDGTFCTPTQSCVETICSNFNIPAYGQSQSYSLALPAGLSSGGSVNFTIAVNGPYPGPTNDFLCNAIDFGFLAPGTTVGNISNSAYFNICASNVNEPNPSPFGFFNEQGVWFTFTTNNDPNSVIINAVSDPSNFGDPINLQLAIYESDNGSCTGNMSLVFNSFNPNDGFNQTAQLSCLDPNTNYFVLVDGSSIVPSEVEGFFGLQIIDMGATAAPDFKCDALDAGQIQDNGSVTFSNQSNHCASHPAFEPSTTGFVSQRSVWYHFLVPSSGHVIIEAESDPTGIDPIGLQIAAFVSSNGTCNGFFTQIQSAYTFMDLDETMTLQCLEPETPVWILIDGDGTNTLGVFNLTISDGGPIAPQSTTDLNPVLCNGGTINIGGNTFSTPGPYSITVNAFNGCDSVISGVITILPPFASTTDTIICSGQTITVGNNTYSTSGTYSDLFTTSDGCDSIVTTNLTVIGDLDVMVTQTVQATNYQIADGAATSIPSGGTAPYTYLWPNGQTTATATNLLGGNNYCVTVTDAIGCSVSDCVLILFPSNIITTLDDIFLDCSGDTDGVLSFSVSNGAAPYDFSWQNLNNPILNGNGTIPNEGGTATLNNLTAGVYSLTISDAFGLMVATGVIEEPAPLVTQLNPTLCAGESLTIGNNTFTSSGPFTEVLTSALGCDSTVTGFLNILAPITSTVNETLCFGESINIGGVIYNSSGPVNEIIPAFNNCDSIITGNVTVLPQILTILDTTICAGESITVNGTSYSQSGNFTETAIANNLCDSVINFNLNVLDAITANITLTTEASGPGLSDGVASASPTGGTGAYSFLWSDGQVNNTATNLMAGQTYCVSVTDALGCTAEDCIVISFPSNIAVNVVNDSLDCNGDTNGSLVLDINLGLAPYSYIWQNAGNTLNGSGTVNTQNGNAVLSNLLPGTYFVTVSDAFGIATAQAFIFEPAPLSAVANSTMTSCFDDCDGTATLTISGGTAPYQYFWPNAAITPSVSALCAGDYQVTVVDAKGCSIISSVTVNQPEELFVTFGGITNVSCTGGADGTAMAALNGNAAGYLWDNGETTATAVNLSAGIHTVSITDVNGCEAVGTIAMNEPEDPVLAVIDLLSEVSCFDGNDGALLAVGAGGEAPYNYNWDNGVSSALSNGLTAGNYFVTVTDNNGCTAEAEATISQPSAIVASFIAKEVTCPEGENSGRITLDTIYGGAGSYYYAIDGLNFTADTVFDNLPAGEYQLSVQDIEGCIQQFPIVVEAPESILLELDEEPIVIDLGESVTLNPLYLNNDLIFEWTGLQAEDCINCPKITTIPTTTTLYEVMATDTTTACTAVAQQLVRVILKRDVYIPNAFSPNGDGINDYFFVNAGPEVARINSLSIYNRWGATMYSITNSQPNDFRNGWNGKFKGKDAENGIYIYVVDVEFIDGERLQYEGDLTLMR